MSDSKTNSITNSLTNTSRLAPESSLKVVGYDVFINHAGLPEMPKTLGALRLTAIANRGTKVWPGPEIHFELCDVHQCRYESQSPGELDSNEGSQLLAQLESKGLHWVHVEKLLLIEGKVGFSSLG